MSDSLLIRSGRVIDPASGLDATGDILLVDGRVAEVSTSPVAVPEGMPTFDAEGCIVTPGLLDIHVHLREPDPTHEETIASGARAAIEGGFTTVCCMPNTRPALDSPDMVRFVHDRAAAAGQARVYVVGCATIGRAGETLAPIREMAAAGVLAFSDDGDVIADDAMMAATLRAAGEVGCCVMQHCQDAEMSAGGVMNAGALSNRLGLGGWPAEAEHVVIERDISLVATAGGAYHVQHLSSGRSVDLIREARAKGLPVTAEASPHHLLLTEEACDGYNTMAKMNPPLRTARDIAALKEGVADGTITVLATDHAPHPTRTKTTDFTSASFGIVGLECALPLYMRALVEGNVIDWPRLVALMTIEPARLVGLDRQGLGAISVGGPADVTIIDPHREWTIAPGGFASAARNCPFAEWTVRGRAVAAIRDGRVLLCRDGSRMGASDPASAISGD